VPSPNVQIRVGPDGRAAAILTGPLDVRTAAGLRTELTRRLAREPVASLDVDVSGVERGDMSGMVILYELAQGRFTEGVQARLVGLRPELEKILSRFCTEAAREARPPRTSLPERAGGAVLELLARARRHVTFTGGVAEAFAAAARRPTLIRRAEVARVFETAGVDALPIVSLVSLLTGFIIAFEAAQPLAAYGAQIYLANTIGRVMTRELGPIMTAVVLAGRSGSAFAAELGTMKVNEELDALETMGLHPLRFLVIQRILAGTLLAPLLTVHAMALGVLGGSMVMLGIGFSGAIIWNQLVSAVVATDVLVGLVKGVVFGTVIAAIGCRRGMETGQGPAAVGVSTTRSVVAGILAIVVIDAVFALLIYVFRV
jgi:phospholipid/cholesterol/gamma-HCH transport system permease protein